jgi:hypothetical protein
LGKFYLEMDYLMETLMEMEILMEMGLAVYLPYLHN